MTLFSTNEVAQFLILYGGSLQGLSINYDKRLVAFWFCNPSSPVRNCNLLKVKMAYLKFFPVTKHLFKGDFGNSKIGGRRRDIISQFSMEIDRGGGVGGRLGRADFV